MMHSWVFDVHVVVCRFCELGLVRHSWDFAVFVVAVILFEIVIGVVCRNGIVVIVIYHSCDFAHDSGVWFFRLVFAIIAVINNISGAVVESQRRITIWVLGVSGAKFINSVDDVAWYWEFRPFATLNLPAGP